MLSGAMIIAVLSAVLGGGGAAMQSNYLEDFEVGDGGFRAVLGTAPVYAEGSPEAEATRLHWIEQLVAEVGTCPNGYDGYAIVRRTVIPQPVFGISYDDVAYDGRCTP